MIDSRQFEFKLELIMKTPFFIRIAYLRESKVKLCSTYHPAYLSKKTCVQVAIKWPVR